MHRDLKPDNILVTPDGRVKILDFGLARQASARTTAADDTRTIAITNPGTVLGTVAYMSLEQARGRDLDARSDQFFLGLILYELAAGKRAFQRESAAASSPRDSGSSAEDCEQRRIRYEWSTRSAFSFQSWIFSPVREQVRF